MNNGSVQAFIGLGSNLADRLEFLRRAVMGLGQAPGIMVIAWASIYETEPVGKLDQPKFLNSVVGVETRRLPLDLLEILLQIESKLGRQRLERWGSRVIDLDLLSYDDMVRTEERLQLPHPQIRFRRFVLTPWAEIAPRYVLPGTSQTIAEWLQRCPEDQIVVPYITASEFGHRIRTNDTQIHLR